MKKLKGKMVFLEDREVRTKGDAMRVAGVPSPGTPLPSWCIDPRHPPRDDFPGMIFLVRIQAPVLGSAKVGAAFSQCLTDRGVREASPLVSRCDQRSALCAPGFSMGQKPISSRAHIIAWLPSPAPPSFLHFRFLRKASRYGSCPRTPPPQPQLLRDPTLGGKFFYCGIQETHKVMVAIWGVF